MLLLDHSSTITHVNDVVLSFKYFPFSDFVFELGAEKPLEWLKLNSDVSISDCYLWRLVCAPPSDGNTHKVIPYSPPVHPQIEYLSSAVL